VDQSAVRRRDHRSHSRYPPTPVGSAAVAAEGCGRRREGGAGRRGAGSGR
jgi:hypothetical protein